MRLEHKCSVCGFDDDRAIHRHHVRNEEGEAIGVILLCANCHNIQHRSEEGREKNEGRIIQETMLLRQQVFYLEKEDDLIQLRLLYEILECYPSPIKIDNPETFMRMKLAIGGTISYLERQNKTYW